MINELVHYWGNRYFKFHDLDLLFLGKTSIIFRWISLTRLTLSFDVIKAIRKH